MKTTDFLNEHNAFIAQEAGDMHMDHEVQMARADCYHAADYAIKLHKILQQHKETGNLEGWVSEKITIANECLRTVYEYLNYEQQEAEMQLPSFSFESADKQYDKLLNEVNPHHYDSDVDYYAAVNAPVRSRSSSRSSYDDGPDYMDPDQRRLRADRERMRKAGLQADHERLATGTNEEQDVEESSQNIGKEILGVIRQIKRLGDDAMENLYTSAPLLAQYWDQYEGDFRSMVIELSPKTLNRIHAEISAVAKEEGLAEGNPIDHDWYRKQQERQTRAKQKQGVGEGEEMGTFAALKDWQVWDVHVFNNFYRGKYADYGPRLYSVVASSPEEAREVILNNADYVLQDLLSRKLQNGKRVLPRQSALPIEGKRVGKAQPGTITTMGLKKMLSPDGVQSFKFAGGKIVDGAHMQGGEEVDEVRVPDVNIPGTDNKAQSAYYPEKKPVSKPWSQTRKYAEQVAQSLFDRGFRDRGLSDHEFGTIVGNTLKQFTNNGQEQVRLMNNDKDFFPLVKRNLEHLEANGTFESKQPVSEMTAGGTGAGGFATGPTAGGGKPGTGKPKKLGNMLKRTTPKIGTGVYK